MKPSIIGGVSYRKAETKAVGCKRAPHPTLARQNIFRLKFAQKISKLEGWEGTSG